MKDKKILKKVLVIGVIITTIVSIMWFINQSTSIADVGSFETYDSDSGSSWSSGSSDWSSSWSSDSSDWGPSWSSDSSDWDSSSDGEGLLGTIIYLLLSPTVPIIFKIIIILIIVAIVHFIRKARSTNIKVNNRPQYTHVRNNSIYDDGPDRSSIIVERIHEHDPNFNSDQFKSYAKDVFIKLQNAWTERDWEKIRVFESNELFEQHKAQLDGYIQNNQINVMERICVNWVRMISYENSGGKELLTVTLNSRMGDYIIDATTKEVIRGNKNTEYTNTYVMQFVRTEGQLTQEGGDKVSTTNCPNCGAPTKIMTSGRCEYCNSVITTTNHGWVLNSLERKS